MQKEIEYKPFDRVTVSCLGAQMQCVILGEHKSRTGNYKVCAFFTDSGDVDGIGALSDEIRPGHYDADGNWLPQPGDPCHVAFPIGVKNMVVVSYNGVCVTAISDDDVEKTTYHKCHLGFVELDFYLELMGGENLETDYFLYPGRIKTSQQ